MSVFTHCSCLVRMHVYFLSSEMCRVMRMGFPPVNSTTAKMTMNVDNSDISCVAGTECSEESWTSGVPDLNFDRPIRKVPKAVQRL